MAGLSLQLTARYVQLKAECSNVPNRTPLGIVARPKYARHLCCLGHASLLPHLHALLEASAVYDNVESNASIGSQQGISNVLRGLLLRLNEHRCIGT